MPVRLTSWGRLLTGPAEFPAGIEYTLYHHLPAIRPKSYLYKTLVQ
jgi:hypothetical protein